MNQNRQRTDVIDFAILVMVLFSVVGATVWWLESRFDPTFALLGVGGLVAVVLFAGGAWMNSRNNQKTLDAAADFLHESSAAYVGHARAHTASAGAVRDQMKYARALADERSKFLVEGKAEAASRDWMGNSRQASTVNMSEFLEYE